MGETTREQHFHGVVEQATRRARVRSRHSERSGARRRLGRARRLSMERGALAQGRPVSFSTRGSITSTRQRSTLTCSDTGILPKTRN
jgi:hypothetical protein